MGYIYRYTDLEDNIIKYVGIVWSDDRKLKYRLKEHEINDEWCRNKKWKIEYLTENINTRTDAEYFESHYISLFRTDKYYNKSKSGWGISSFLPNRENDWKIYNDELFCCSDYIFKVSIKDNKEFYIETIPVIKKLCKTKKEHDYHCKCGSNELYKKENRIGQLYCKECGLWVRQCDKHNSSLYTPEYNGEYIVDDNGEIIMYEYYSLCHNKHIGKYQGFRKEELENIISMSAYALTEDKIEEAKLKILTYINKQQEKEIVELEEKLNMNKKYHNDLIMNFSSYLNN